MSIRNLAGAWFWAAGCLIAASGLIRGASPAELVILQRIPNSGLQPQVQVGGDGMLHLIYFIGADSAGDLFYVRRGPADAEFTAPLHVNSTPGSAIATGTIRGAQVAIGADNSVHVAWNGSDKAQPKGPKGEIPLLHTRLTAEAVEFEPERNVIRQAYGLDGGCCLAANSAGSVYIAWHAGLGQEGSRRVWLVHSTDNGQTFGEERAIDSERVGACGCCGMSGTVSPEGHLMMLYRAAREELHRDMYLLTSSNHGVAFTSRKLHDWTIGACPMSSAAFGHGDRRSWAAWESAEQVYLVDLTESQPRAAPAPAPGSGARRKHPRLAVNHRGDLLLVWTEGTGWKRGGSLAWQLYDQSGGRIGDPGAAPNVPTWSFPAPYARQDGTFIILY